MALEGLTQEKLEAYEQQLLAKIPDGGKSIGNTNLRNQLEWHEDLYWGIRDRLLDRGILELGRGKGGSVKRSVLSTTPATSTVSTKNGPVDDKGVTTPKPSEDSLYGPMAVVLRDKWVKDKRYDQAVVEITAKQGARLTGGKWTRPDTVMASLTTFPYVPGKHFDVTTFEVKRHDAADVTVVYEALAHLRSATRAYVLIHLPDEFAESYGEPIEVIQEEAERHGVGVIVVGDPANYETWEEKVEARRQEPDPEKLNDF